MYTLRIINEDNTVSNQYLGDNYTVTHCSTSPEEFKELCRDFTIENDLGVYAILVGENCKEVWALRPGKKYFIMTESGKTFEKL
ncbi:MAG: hypothetical protein ACFE9R_13620 [Candidatus Hermodarchaeota archaeon]